MFTRFFLWGWCEDENGSWCKFQRYLLFRLQISGHGENMRTASGVMLSDNRWAMARGHVIVIRENLWINIYIRLGKVCGLDRASSSWRWGPDDGEVSRTRGSNLEVLPPCSGFKRAKYLHHKKPCQWMSLPIGIMKICTSWSYVDGTDGQFKSWATFNAPILRNPLELSQILCKVIYKLWFG